MLLRKSHIFSIILFLVVGLTLAFFYIYSQPGSSGSPATGELTTPDTALFSTYARARVLSVAAEPAQYPGLPPLQKVSLQFLTGERVSEVIEIDHEEPLGTVPEQQVQQGDTVVVGQLQPNNSLGAGVDYIIVDKYRLPALGIILVIFFVLALLFGKIRGVTSIGGLAFSIFLLIYFIVPNITAGHDPVLISLVGSSMIIIVSIFMAHGFNVRSALATISTFITLGLAVGLSHYFVGLAKLFGLGSEEAFFLQSGLAGSLNMKGLLLAGIIIGTLGILDDVTTTQAAAVDEIYKTNPKLNFKELYQKASIIGKEHIASLINTLVLAYAGASLPLFLLLTMSADQPLWVLLNSEFMAEEIVRTLVGSAALILAVPISTILAAYYFHHSERPLLQE